jgi:phosphoserine phosphatase
MQILSTPEFEAAVAELAPRIAVFDCDGTLWSGDAGSTFMHWSFENGCVAPTLIPWLKERYRLYLAGEVNEYDICEDMVRVYSGETVGLLRQAAAEFFAEFIEPNIFPEMKRLVATLQAQGTEIWAVSSTNAWVIEEGVKRFNIPPERVLAAGASIHSDFVIFEPLMVPTDEFKVKALANAGVTHPDAVFGNSVHDAAMLSIARKAFPVNPTPALVERSRREGWAVYYPESVRPA